METFINNTPLTNLWEEKNSIEPKKNFVNKIELEPADFTKDTKTESEKNVCEDTGNKKKANRILESKRYYLKNREKIKNRVKLRRQQNHDKLIQREKIYRKKNYEKHKEHHRQERKRYYKENKQDYQLRDRKHYFKKLTYGANSRHINNKITPFDLWKIAKKQKLLCALTGEKLTNKNMSVDHIIPKSKGGLNIPSNIRLILCSVNIARQNMTDEEFIKMCEKVVNYKS